MQKPYLYQNNIVAKGWIEVPKYKILFYFVFDFINILSFFPPLFLLPVEVSISFQFSLHL
jgi:hypothetical protein